jgi:hypothetical protein
MEEEETPETGPEALWLLAISLGIGAMVQQRQRQTTSRGQIFHDIR